MSEELKPCPFCAGKPNLNKCKSDVNIWYSIGCEECECQTAEFKSKEEVVKRWNKRK